VAAWHWAEQVQLLAGLAADNFEKASGEHEWLL